MEIRLERAKSGESGLWFQKENSAKRLKLTKNLSLLTNESAFFFKGEKKLLSKLKKKNWNIVGTFFYWRILLSSIHKLHDAFEIYIH